MEYFSKVSVPTRNLQKPSRYDRNFVLYPEDGSKPYLSTPVPLVIAESPTDRYHTVTPREVGRLDLIAFKYYGTTLLWWVICSASGIYNPFEVQQGDILRIPSRESLYGYKGILT